MIEFMCKLLISAFLPLLVIAGLLALSGGVYMILTGGKELERINNYNPEKDNE